MTCHIIDLAEWRSGRSPCDGGEIVPMPVRTPFPVGSRVRYVARDRLGVVTAVWPGPGGGQLRVACQDGVTYHLRADQVEAR